MAMEASDWVIVGATLLGPVLAVQAQKMVERFQSKQSQREAVFRALMATRGARLSNEHVAALNMIDLVFYGKGDGRRGKGDEAVIEAWRAYLDHLSIDYNRATPEEQAALSLKREDLFSSLLYSIAARVGYRFTQVQIRKGLYLPNAHEAQERSRQQVQAILPRLLAGSHPLAVKVSASDELAQANAHQQDWQASILKTLEQIRDGQAVGQQRPRD